jgi:PAS domain S-box-containing protein
MTSNNKTERQQRKDLLSSESTATETAAAILGADEPNYKQLVDSGQALVWATGPDHIRYYFNKVWLEFTGRTLSEETENGWMSAMHPTVLQSYLDTCSEAFERREKFSVVYRLRRRDGKYRWMLEAGCPQHNNAVFSGYIGHCLDITDFRNTESIYQDNRNRTPRGNNEVLVQEVLEHSLDASYKHNLITDSYEYLSPVIKRISGYSAYEMKTATIAKIVDLIHPDDRATINRIMLESIADTSGKQYQVEYRFRHKDGEYRWFLDRFTVFRDKNGYPSARIGSVSDITERKATLQKLTDLLLEHQTILDTADIGISKVVQRKQVWVNRKTVDLFQYSKEEMEGQSTRKLYPSQDAYNTLGNIAYPVLAQGLIFETEQELIRKDGIHLLVRYIGRAIESSDMSKGTIWLLEDITQKKKNEQELKQSEERFRKLFLENMAVILIIDPDTGRIVEANSAAEKFYGWTLQKLSQMRIQDINMLPPAEIEQRMQSTKRSGPLQMEFRHRRADGSVSDVEVFSSLILLNNKDFLYSIIHDISGRKLAEKALLDSEEKYRKVFENLKFPERVSCRYP